MRCKRSRLSIQRARGRRDRLGLDSEPLIPAPPRSRPATVPPSPALLLPVQLEYDAPIRPDRPPHRDIALHLSVGADREGGAVRAPPAHQVARGVATGGPRT